MMDGVVADLDKAEQRIQKIRNPTGESMKKRQRRKKRRKQQTKKKVAYAKLRLLGNIPKARN
jgi:hypothetical protein